MKDQRVIAFVLIRSDPNQPPENQPTRDIESHDRETHILPILSLDTPFSLHSHSATQKGVKDSSQNTDIQRQIPLLRRCVNVSCLQRPQIVTLVLLILLCRRLLKQGAESSDCHAQELLVFLPRAGFLGSAASSPALFDLRRFLSGLMVAGAALGVAIDVSAAEASAVLRLRLAGVFLGVLDVSSSPPPKMGALATCWSC